MKSTPDIPVAVCGNWNDGFKSSPGGGRFRRTGGFVLYVPSLGERCLLVYNSQTFRSALKNASKESSCCEPLPPSLTSRHETPSPDLDHTSITFPRRNPLDLTLIGPVYVALGPPAGFKCYSLKPLQLPPLAVCESRTILFLPPCDFATHKLIPITRIVSRIRRHGDRFP